MSYRTEGPEFETHLGQSFSLNNLKYGDALESIECRVLDYRYLRVKELCDGMLVWIRNAGPGKSLKNFFEYLSDVILISAALWAVVGTIQDTGGSKPTRCC